MSVSIRFIFFLTALCIISHFYIPKKNNICKTFTDYYFPQGNDNCYYDPDTALKIPELIKKYTGRVELHEVLTEDGYILTLFRIPRKNAKGTILLHHSVATNPRIYLWQGNDSLAMTLWHNGYDVWLANQRGTSYSDRHVNMTKDEFRYWNFSFHEIGLYDVTSEVELIRKATNGSKIIYFGHSLGATAGLVYSSLKSSEAEKFLKYMILLSPGVHFKFITVSTTFLKYSLRTLQVFTDFLQSGSPFPHLLHVVYLSRYFLRLFPPAQYISAILAWIFGGFTPQETDPTFFNFDFGIYVNNFSWKTMYHYVQVEHNFQMYDYGEDENLKIYGNVTPTLYPVEEITVPTLIVSSSNDNLVQPEECDEIFNRMSSDKKIHGLWKCSEFNHLDFLAGLDRRKIFVDPLIEYLNKIC